MQTAIQEFFNTMLTPALLAGAAYLLAFGSKLIKKYFARWEIQMELNDLEKTTKIKNNILSEIKTIVESVVGSNMQYVKALKEGNGGKLTDEQAAAIHDDAKNMIYASLPSSITADDGVLMSVIGGYDVLDNIIENMMEKSVYDKK